MPVWFLIVLVLLVVFAIGLAVAMSARRRSAGGQNVTIIEDRK